MTGQILLGFVPDAAVTPADAGPHHRLDAAGLSALSIDLTPDLSDGSEAAITAIAQIQNDLLCSYALEFDVLPVALGAGFSDGRTLARFVADTADDLVQRMSSIAGRAEYTLHLLSDTTATLATPKRVNTGADHLRHRRARRDARQGAVAKRARILADLDTLLPRIACDHRVRAAKRTGRLAAYDLLVRRDRIAAALDALRSAAAAAAPARVKFVLTGPCAPFSFAQVTSHG